MAAVLTLDSLTNQGQGTVTAGGTTAPAQGTSESWTVTAANAFPAVSVAAGTCFRVIDPAQLTEIMLVTAAPGGTGSGQSWTVTSGAESTTPVAHAANAVIYEIITGGLLAKMPQGLTGIGGQVGWALASANGSGTLVAALAAVAGTDGNSNAFAAGYTGPTQGIQPGSSPAAVETWHTITLDTGWVTPSPSGYSPPKYRLLPDGNLQLAGSAGFAAGFTGSKALNSTGLLPVAYRPISTKDFRSGDPVGARCHVSLNASGQLTANAYSGYSSGALYAEIDAVLSLL
jgi:hypothetical protein